VGFLGRNDDERRRAFEAEAVPHLDTLYAVALRLTRRPAEAEDLAQDALLKAYRFFDRYEPGTNMRAWLLRILTNTFINRCRRRALERQTVEGDAATPIGEGVVSRAAMRALSEPFGEAERRLLAQEIRGAMDTLSDEQRAIIVLADLEELSYREIAEVLDVPVGTVMSRLHRARNALKVRLVSQARALGIVPDETDQEDAAPPVSLEAYRRRKDVAR
jgi:RNA polymerase sigma-70 factor (ECF subfamily)